MARLVIDMDDALLHAARQRAHAQGTTLEARVHGWLMSEVATGLPPWLTDLRERVATFGGAEPDEWIPPRDPTPPGSTSST